MKAKLSPTEVAVDVETAEKVKDVAQLVERWVWIGANTVSTPRCGEGFFSESQLSVQILLWCLYSHHV